MSPKRGTMKSNNPAIPLITPLTLSRLKSPSVALAPYVIADRFIERAILIGDGQCIVIVK
jgi:hypothetical protein